MIAKWGLKNFKSFREAELELAPLTIITGVNSSGKSSLLQSIAMLAQSARNKDNKPIILKGNLVDLGEFKDIYCNNPCKISKYEDADDNLVIAFSISKDEYEYIHFECLLSSVSELPGPINVNTLHMECKKEGKDLAFMNLDTDGEFEPISPLENNNVFDPVSENEIKGKNPENVQLDFCREIYDSHFRHFLPGRISFPYIHKVAESDINKFLALLETVPSSEEASDIDMVLKYAERKMKEYKLNDNLVSNMLWELTHDEGIFLQLFEFEKLFIKFKKFDKDGNYNFGLGLSDWYMELSMLDEQKREKIINDLKKESFKILLREKFKEFEVHTPSILPLTLEDAANCLHAYFKSRIGYLGPLREDPQWRYKKNTGEYEGKKDEKILRLIHKWEENPVVDIGVKGEKTPYVIDNLVKYTEVEKYYSPDFFDSPDYLLKKEGFKNALEEWLQYLEIADKVYTQEFEEYCEMFLEKDRKRYALPQLGTGVSQIVPILVMCLAAPLGCTLIFQQPEEQLHPKMQSKLADFFIAMALSGRQCIIETHSEYLIEQLRYRIVTLSEKEKLHEKTKLYFVTKRVGVSYPDGIQLNEYADLSEWPKDFFDESHIVTAKLMGAVIEKEDAGIQDE